MTFVLLVKIPIKLSFVDCVTLKQRPYHNRCSSPFESNLIVPLQEMACSSSATAWLDYQDRSYSFAKYGTTKSREWDRNQKNEYRNSVTAEEYTANSNPMWVP